MTVDNDMKDLIARQHHTSPPMRKFNFARIFGLTPYSSKRRPLVVFGCYREKDIPVIKKHRGRVILVWGGNDTVKIENYQELTAPNIIHLAGVPTMVDYLQGKGIDCRLMNMFTRTEKRPEVTPLGERVYTYLQKGKPEYHGADTIAELDIEKYSLLTGTHNVPRQQWYHGEADKWYRQTFVGLFLSHYAGGAQGVIEMGLRGRNVITNVLRLPHCIPWETKEDIEREIDNQAEKIGTTQPELADDVYRSLVHPKGNGFYLKEMLS